MKAEQINGPLSIAITNAFAIRGIGNVTSDQISDIRKFITKEIQEYFGTFRLNEFILAIEFGAKGQFERDGDLNTVSVELILKWWSRFNDTIRRPANHKQILHEKKIAEIKTEEEKLAGIMWAENQTCLVYEGFCNGSIDLIGIADELKESYFRCMESKGLINSNVISSQDSDMIWHLAEGKLLEFERIESEERRGLRPQSKVKIVEQTRIERCARIAQSLAFTHVCGVMKSKEINLRKLFKQK